MVIAHCTKATLNVGTNGPFSAQVILDVFKTSCYDDDPGKPWSHLPPSQKTALSPELKVSREEWAETMLGKGHQSRWYLNHCVWLDPCSTIVPGSKKTAFDHQQATFGKRKRWMSAGSKNKSRNMRPSPYAGKQAQWGDKRVWWFIVLAKGRVHLEVMPDGWRQNGEGQAYMVSLLPSILRSMLGATCKMPDVLFTYRGLASFIYQLVPSVLSMQLLSMPMGLLPGRDTTGSGKPQILLTSCCMKRQLHGLGAT